MLDVSRVDCCCHRRRDCRDRSHRHRDRQIEATNEHQGPRKKQADEATSTLLARGTEENSTKSQNGTSSNLRTFQTKSSNNRSTAEKQAVSESNCTEQVSLSSRSPTSTQTSAPKKLLVTSFPSSLKPGILVGSTFSLATTEKTQKNVAATNAKTSSS